MIGIGKLQEDVVCARGQSLNDDRLLGCMKPVPGRVVHCNMKMPNARRDAQCCFSIDRNDLQIFRSERDDRNAPRQGSRECLHYGQRS